MNRRRPAKEREIYAAQTPRPSGGATKPSQTETGAQ